jgi:quercetin dioxygenase-like cupin family protein
LNMTARFLACFIAVMLSAPVVQAQQPAGETPGVRHRSDDIKFLGNPAGQQTAILFGNPLQSGLFVTRVKFPAGLKILPHWHPDSSRTVVVLSGTLYFGLGERWDDSKLEARPAGTFFSEAAKTPHFAWAKDGEVIIQITSIGPTGTTLIAQ